jgi:RNA 2',3'-cyclic 3'-phosphodiesterase
MSVLPLYLVIKPPAAVAREIDLFRHARGIERSYPPERLHMTLLPVGGLRPFLDRLIEAAGSLQVDPFSVTLDRLDGNALAGSSMRTLRDFQRRLVRRLAFFGLPLPAYSFRRPHLSLTYGDRLKHRGSIPPIRWQMHEFLLIQSGHGRHDVLARWQLTLRQGSFGF